MVSPSPSLLLLLLLLLWLLLLWLLLVWLLLVWLLLVWLLLFVWLLLLLFVRLFVVLLLLFSSSALLVTRESSSVSFQRLFLLVFGMSQTLVENGCCRQGAGADHAPLRYYTQLHQVDRSSHIPPILVIVGSMSASCQSSKDADGHDGILFGATQQLISRRFFVTHDLFLFFIFFFNLLCTEISSA